MMALAKVTFDLHLQLQPAVNDSNLGTWQPAHIYPLHHPAVTWP